MECVRGPTIEIFVGKGSSRQLVTVCGVLILSVSVQTVRTFSKHLYKENNRCEE